MRLLKVVCVLSMALSLYPAAFAADWLPIDQQALALKTPKLDPNADAEVLLWDVRLTDEVMGSNLRLGFVHYLRVKIYNDRGVESQGTVDLTWEGKGKVSDIAARTIKPDGSIIELKKNAIFDKTVAKSRDVKLKAKSFALPGVEPGAIIEYRYKEYRDDQLAHLLRLDFQRDIPTWHARYHIKPIQLPGFVMQAKPFQAAATPFTEEPQGYYMTEMRDIPAFKEEPRMPPSASVRPWLLIYYVKANRRVVEEKDVIREWETLAKELHKNFQDEIKPNGDIKKALPAILGDASTPREKLMRISRYCRTQIKRVFHDRDALSNDEQEQYLKKRKRGHSPSDTLKAGRGLSGDLNPLFASLAAAAGFDVRIARLPGRNSIFFEKSFPNIDLFARSNIAVNVEGEWLFFDPSAPYVTEGMLRWPEEGAAALVSDPKEPIFLTTPFSEPEKTVATRRATLTLGADGTLEGDVEVEYTGHLSVSRKSSYDALTPQERQDRLTEAVQDDLPEGTEVSKVEFESVTDPDKPFCYRYKIRIPGYAQVTGKRVFLQPAFFQKGNTAEFPTSTRVHDIHFSFAWTEKDDVTIQLPDGFSGSNVTEPQSIGFGEVGEYKVGLLINENGALHYRREFAFGRGGRVIFPKAAYQQLKTVFDKVHENDTQLVTITAQTAAN